MTRRANNECLILKEEADGNYSDTNAPRTKYTTYCGRSDFSRWRMTDHAGLMSCPKCSAKYHAGRAGGLTLERFALPENYDAPRPYGVSYYGTKSAYRIMQDGECYGLVTIPTGFGKKWEIRALEAPVTIGMVRDGAEPKATITDKVAQYKRYDKDKDGNRLPVGVPLWEGSSILVREPYKSDAKHFASKEAALEQCGDMIADGFLKSESSVIAAAREEYAREVAERQQAAARREVEAQAAADRAREKSDELDLIAMAFAEMVTEGKISNFQREAVFLAAKHLGIKGLD